MTTSLLPTDKGRYRDLKVYQKTECIYDITFFFAEAFLKKGDRTADQMVQAARSGNQNIAEGAAAAPTSAETELKLTNVAKASLQELLVDYEDYLRVRGLEQWAAESERYQQTRRVCARRNDSAFYREAIKVRSAETIANIAITLIHQADMMLAGLLMHQQEGFLKNGGVKERLTQARLEYRKKTKGY